RRRDRNRRHVEGVRRDGAPRLDRRWASQDDLRAGGGLGSPRGRVWGRVGAPTGRVWGAGGGPAEPWSDAATAASGLRVPAAIGDYLILDAVRASGGTALAVDDATMIADMQVLAREEGISAAPEGAATLAAARVLLARGFLRRDER